MTPEQKDILLALVPVLVALLTLLGGGLVYGWQKRSDRRNQILAERRELYRKFVSKVQFLQMDIRTRNWEHAHGNFTDYRAILAELIVTAPDSIVAPLGELDENFAAVISKTFGTKSEGGLFDGRKTDSDHHDIADLKRSNSRIFNTVVSEMRRDSFKDSRLTAGNVAYQYPNGW